MKTPRRIRWLIWLIALVIALGACAPAALPEEPEEEDIINGHLVLVDPETSESGPYLPERPSADDQPLLPEEISQEEDPPEPPATAQDKSPSQASAPQSSQAGAAAPPQAQSQPPDTSALSSPASSPPPANSTPPAASPVAEIPESSAPATAQSNAASHAAASAPQRIPVSGEVRGVWISYLELDGLLRGKSKSQFTANIRAVFDNCKNYGLNTVIVQVRPFADALYKSEYFPWSYLCTGTEGVDPGFDPLAVMVEEARACGLRIEAWLNPYRVRAAGSKNALSADNQANIWLNAGDSAVIRYDGVTSYNPASPKARELIVNGAREIVRNYNVDGIHIDDYFYPTMDAAFDAASYSAYRNGGGSLSLADWRRQNVETLMKALYSGIKAENSNVLFGISPQSSVYNNYHAMYLDVAKISAGAGYCDYICPQIYFGYQNAVQPYQETLETWNKMVNADTVDLYIGLAVYKSGVVDNWAGAGKDEWRQNTDLIKRMVESARTQSAYSGFVLYRYDSLFNPAQSARDYVSKEYNNLKGILR